MRKTIALALSLLLAVALTACSPPSDPTPPASPAASTPSSQSQAAPSGDSAPAQGTTITYVTLGDTGMNQLKKAAEEFEAQTGIKVKLESWAYSDAYQKIITLCEAGTPPDAMYGFSGWTQQFKDLGYTAPLDGLISQQLIDDFSAAALDVCTVDGQLWVLPSYMSIRSILYNKNHLDAAGITELPTTWQEFLEIAPKLVGGGKYAYSMVAGHPKNTLDCFLPILWAHDADVASADGKTNGFNNENGVAALQVYCDLAKFAVPDYGEADINFTQNNFTTQTASAYIHNAQGLAALADAGEDYSWAVIGPPLKGPGGSQYSLGIMDVDLVFKTGNEEAAGKWLEFWHTKDRMGDVIEQAGWVPNQKSFFERPAFTDPENVMVAPFAALEPMAKFKPTISSWEEVQKIMADYITKAVMGEMTPAEAFAEAGPMVDELLQK